jgi:hypothetical protein
MSNTNFEIKENERMADICFTESYNNLIKQIRAKSELGLTTFDAAIMSDRMEKTLLKEGFTFKLITDPLLTKKYSNLNYFEISW